jgi:hypothetical protein
VVAEAAADGEEALIAEVDSPREIKRQESGIKVRLRRLFSVWMAAPPAILQRQAEAPAPPTRLQGRLWRLREINIIGPDSMQVPGGMQ